MSLPELIGGVDAATGVETLLAFAGIVPTSLSAALIGGYLATAFVRYQFGQEVTLCSCLLATVRRLPALLGPWLLGHCWMLLVAWAMVAVAGRDLAPWLVLIVPGGALVLVFALFVSPVVVIEGRRPFGAVVRATSLVRSRSGPPWRSSVRELVASDATFERAADLFDDAWFGDLADDVDDDDTFIALEREVLAAGTGSP